MLTLRKLFPWILVVLWMTLIYNFSAQPAVHSEQLSMGVTEVVVETLNQVIPHSNLSVEGFDHIVRKNAHFFIYLMLAIWVSYALQKSGVTGRKGFFLAIGICFLYAVTDEIHQIYVPGRGPQIRDVLIDSSGALVGIGLFRLGSMALKKWEGHRGDKRRPSSI